MRRRRRKQARISDLEWRTALVLYDEHGWTIARVARDYACTYWTAWYNLKALGAKRRRSPAWHTVKGRRVYQVWQSMRQRCTNPKHAGYRHCGGRGVDVCAEWQKFDPFYEWAVRSRYALGQSLALVDRDRDFSPKNCRWISARESRRAGVSRRPERTSTRMITAFGEIKTMRAWAHDPRCAVSEPSLVRRLFSGVAPEAAITSPPRTRWDAPLPHKRGPRMTPRKRDLVDWARVLRMHRVQGRSPSEIAAELGRSYTTIWTGLRVRGALTLRSSPTSTTPDGHRLYLLWRSLLSRTTDPRKPLYRFSGALGVRVCREWREFEPFYEWAMRTGSKPNLCLARTDRRKGYSPGNCRWITRAELLRETRGER